MFAKSVLGENGQWQRYTEIVRKRSGRRKFDIYLRAEGGPVGLPRGLGITSQEGGLLSTAGAVGTTSTISALAAGTALGSWAGPIGAGVGALVGIIAGLFAASAARAKGAKEENDAINEYLPAWDSGMQAIFQAANNGTATPSECISALQSLMSYWWQAAAQFKGLPGVADASNGGSNCGTYTPGVTTACSPTGGPNCDQSCTAFCCIGCRDLMPSASYAAYLFGLPQGGSLNVCTVYSSKYGASQRNQYTLVYTPPPAASVAGVATSATTAVTSALGVSDSSFGTPLLLLGAAALAAYFLL